MKWMMDHSLMGLGAVIVVWLEWWSQVVKTGRWLQITIWQLSNRHRQVSHRVSKL